MPHKKAGYKAIPYFTSDFFYFHYFILSKALHYCLYDRLTSDPYLLYAGFLIPVKIKAEHIPLIFMVILKILCQLFLASFVVLIAMPDFQFNNKLLSEIIHDHICTPWIPCIGAVWKFTSLKLSASFPPIIFSSIHLQIEDTRTGYPTLPYNVLWDYKNLPY